MVPTMPPRFASWTVLLFVALGSCQGFQLPNQPLAPRFAPGQRTGATSCPSLSVGADYDFDSDFEVALGQAYISEYERDAEFYRKRNEAYYNSLREAEKEEVVVAAEYSFSDVQAQASPDGVPPSNTDPAADHRWVTDSINTSIKASQSSFRLVEKTTFSLLKARPMFAIAMFATAGMIVAYMSGFFFMEGYIENWNPVQNDLVPYWNDAEIHTIERALPLQP